MYNFKIFDMRIKIILSFVLLCSVSVWAQNIKRPDSYNYTRAIEAIENNNVEEALQYLNKEIEEHPESGYAYSWLALINHNQEKYGLALTAANMAIKKIPSKDKEYVAFAYSTRGKVYLCLEDTVRALKDYSQAIGATPDDSQIYNQRAQIYYEQGKYSLADADYNKMISIDEGDVMGYMGIGRNANAQKRWNDAIKQFDHVIKLASDYSSGYSFRATSFFAQRKYDKAIDDVIKALSIDGDDKAFYFMQTLADSALTQTTTKLKIQKVKEPNDNRWNYYLGIVYEHVNKYNNATAYYKEALNKESSAAIANRLANCYNELGDYEKAMSYCNQAISLDSMDMNYILLKANIEDNAGKTKDAIATMSSIIEQTPDNAYGYYRRGWFKDHSGDVDGAIDDYTLSIALEPNDAYTYLNRAVLYRLKGEVSMAEEDFKQVIRLDTVPEKIECAHYAYYYLGDKEKAISIINNTLEKDDKDNYYDAACLYSIMGDKEKSIDYLHKALELGYRKFAHIKRDRDLNNIRNDEAYKALIEEYENKHEQEISAAADDPVSYEEQTEEIPFAKEGDMCKVKCTINDLPLHFIFDTGASDVSLSSVEATFMIKNGYLSSSDIVGKQRYLTADGNVSEGTIVNLREVKLGTMHLENIKASVVRNQAAPLLLGQSVLRRLGKIEIDNNKKVLKVTYKVKK